MAVQTLIIPTFSVGLEERDFFENNAFKYTNKEIDTLIDYIYKRIYQNMRTNLGGRAMDLNRLIVMDMAKNEGLQTPNYEIITSGMQLLQSKKSLGEIVTKTIENGIYDTYKGKRYYNYTETIDNNFYTENKNTQFAPSLISQLIEKQYEIRSFYLDGDFYSMAIFSQTDQETVTDFRKGDTPVNVPYKLPNEIENKLRCLYKKLNLNTGSADFIVDKNGNYIFLEINPVGQFGMTSEPCNYNLEQKVADFLIK